MERKGCGYLLDKVAKVFSPKNGFTSEELAQHLYGDDPELANIFGEYLEGLLSGKVKGGFVARRNDNGSFDVETDVEDMRIDLDDSKDKTK